MKIGNTEIENGAFLGPMAGFTDKAFRIICREQGAALCYTEMVSAKAMFYNNKNTYALLNTEGEAPPKAAQLFGSEPEIMANQAKRLEESGFGAFDIIDINMGCPMPKIVNNGEGSALMKEPELCGKIIREMADMLKTRVTVKIRSGFDEANINAPEIAKIAEANGAAAVTIHGRTREQYYSGKADWGVIKAVKKAVSIPVIGSGDITDAASAIRMLEETGCDAVMVARAARGNPWIFKEIKAALDGKSAPDPPSFGEIKQTMLRQLDMMISYAGEESAVRQMRKHAGFYVRGITGAAALRRDINKAESRSELAEILTSLRD